MNSENFDLADRLGRKWDLRMDYSAARRIDAADYSVVTPTKWSILDLNRTTLQLFVKSDSLLLMVIWAIVRPQAVRLHKLMMKIDDPENPGTQIEVPRYAVCPDKDEDAAQDEFCRGVDGPTMTKAKEVFWASLGNFFPEHATALSQLIQEHERAKKKMSVGIAAMREEIAETMDTFVEEGLTKMRETMKEEKAKALKTIRGGELGGTSTES